MNSVANVLTPKNIKPHLNTTNMNTTSNPRIVLSNTMKNFISPINSTPKTFSPPVTLQSSENITTNTKNYIITHKNNSETPSLTNPTTEETSEYYYSEPISEITMSSILNITELTMSRNKTSFVAFDTKLDPDTTASLITLNASLANNTSPSTVSIKGIITMQSQMMTPNPSFPEYNNSNDYYMANDTSYYDDYGSVNQSINGQLTAQTVTEG